MKKITFLIFLILPITLFSYEVMPVDSVKAGMKGYGISVFGGNLLDTFDVEILGVLENVGPGRKLIIARLSGAGLEKTGIIAGMSGSPIFINEKIIGAAAYGWSFSIEPITGITPIDEMLATKVDSTEEVDEEPEIEIRGAGRMSPYTGVTLTRIRTPLFISGFDGWLIKDINNFFEERGFSVVLGGGASGKGDVVDSLFVGSGVGARLVGGDASIGAIGTVTYIEGKDVFAFGHPLFFSGTVSIPMTTSYVYAIMASQISSFKISSIEKEVGAILQDRRDAIYGVIGEKAKTIPLNVEVTKRKEKSVFHFDLIDSKQLTPFLAGIVLANSIIVQGRRSGSLSLSLELNLNLEKYGDIKLKNFFSGENALGQSMNNISNVLRLILEDRFERIKIKEISIKTNVIEKERVVEIGTVKPGKFTVRRGGEVDLTVFLKGMEGKVLKEKFSIKIPETYSDSIVKIAVVGAGGLLNLEVERAANRYMAERPGQVLELLRDVPRNNFLYCLLLSYRTGMIVSGYELGSLPSSILHLMGDSQDLGEGRFTRGGIVTRIERECDFLVSGSNLVTLKIVD